MYNKVYITDLKTEYQLGIINCATRMMWILELSILFFIIFVNEIEFHSPESHCNLIMNQSNTKQTSKKKTICHGQ